MQLSQAGVAFIQGQESCVLTPYADPGGLGTSIGYGHFYSNTTPASQIPQTITKAQATSFFNSDVASFVTTVNQSLSVSVSQSAFDALVDYTYTRGGPNYLSSGIPQAINSGDLQAAANIIRTTGLGCGTKAQAALQNRRNLEAQMLLGQSTLSGNSYLFPST